VRNNNNNDNDDSSNNSNNSFNKNNTETIIANFSPNWCTFVELLNITSSKCYLEPSAGIT